MAEPTTQTADVIVIGIGPAGKSGIDVATASVQVAPAVPRPGGLVTSRDVLRLAAQTLSRVERSARGSQSIAERPPYAGGCTRPVSTTSSDSSPTPTRAPSSGRRHWGPTVGGVLGLLTPAAHAQVPPAQLRTMISAYPTFHRGIEDALNFLDS